MQIYLANKVKVVFPELSDDGKAQAWQTYLSIGKVFERSSLLPVTIAPVQLLSDSDQIKNTTEKLDEAGLGVRTGDFWNVAITVALYTSSKPFNAVEGVIRINDVGTGGILELLREAYRPGELKMTVVVENFKNERKLPRNMIEFMSFTEEEISDVGRISLANSYGVEKSGLGLKGHTSVEYWNDLALVSLEAYISIFVVVPDYCANVDASVPDKLCVNKKLLLEEVFTDAIIIASNGVGVKCHKSHLAVHSSVLATMFHTNMQESQTNTVEMPDMCEASVRALLAYLYYWETKEAVNNSRVCFQLYAAGHKYNICKLENCMEKILLGKDSDWYDDTDVAINLFLFSRKLHNVNLIMKTIKVLKSKVNNLNDCTFVQDLLKEDPEAVIDLCKYLLIA